MTTESAECAARLEEKCFSAPWSVSALEESAFRADGVFRCAYINGEFAGHAGMLCVLDEGQVCNIAVEQSYRRIGVGRALVEALIEEARNRHLSVLYLEVRASNTPAQRLYESFGFEKVGARRAYYENPREDAFLYNLYLK